MDVGHPDADAHDEEQPAQGGECGRRAVADEQDRYGCRVAEDQREQQDASIAEPTGRAGSEPGAEERPDPASGEYESDVHGAEPEIAHREQEQSEDEDLVEEVERRRLPEQRTHVPVAKGKAETLAPRRDATTCISGSRTRPGSTVEIRQRLSADTRKVVAFTRTATGAVSTPTMAPPMPFPAISFADWGRRELPVRVDELVARDDGRHEREVGQLVQNGEHTGGEDRDVEELHSGHSGPHDQRDGPDEDERPRSAPIISGRRARRSTSTPSGRVASRNGRNCAVRRRPTSAALAERVMIASRGRASSPISEPNHDTADAATAAPGQLEVVRGFVNTRDLEAGTDAIATSTALADWLVGAGLLPPDEPVGPADVEAAGRLREALREALAANHDGRPLADEVVRALNDATRAAEISVAVTPSPGWAHRPAASGTAGAFGGDPRRRPPGDVGGHVAPAEGVRQRHLPVGVLRPLPGPVGQVVLDGCLRQPGQAAGLAPAALLDDDRRLGQPGPDRVLGNDPRCLGVGVGIRPPPPPDPVDRHRVDGQ